MEIYRADFFCVAIRTDLWDLLKGISEDFGMGYYEDFDFCLRAKSKGYNPYLYEKWFVYHQGSASFGANKKDLSLLLKKNKRVLKHKHKIIEFRHRRNDILLFLIKHSRKLINNNLLTKLRIEYLQHDLPRSPLKKIIWKIKIKLLIHYHLKIV
jgi:GT2 family glycosyltransferase